MITLIEFYEKIGGDYYEVLSRLGKDERIVKYLKLFTLDDSYKSLLNNINEENYSDAFRNIHTIKGMCLNLGFGSLGTVSSELCELLRPQVKPDVDIVPYINSVTSKYYEVLNAIDEL